MGTDLRPAELVAVPEREVERRDRREGRRERVFPEGRRVVELLVVLLQQPRQEDVEPHDIERLDHAVDEQKRVEELQEPEPRPVWKSNSELGYPNQTSELSISAKSTSIRLISERIDCFRQVLEARQKISRRNGRMRSH